MRPRLPLTAVAAAATLSLLLAGCTNDEPSPSASSVGPVLSAAAVPDGMGKYSYSTRQLSVTINAAGAEKTAAEVADVVDALVEYRVSLATATDTNRHVILTATWLEPATSADLRAAQKKVAQAEPSALVVTATRDIVGVTWHATLVEKPAASFPQDVADQLPTTVAGRYDVTVDGNDLSVTWLAPGLTTDGLAAVTATLARLCDVKASEVDVVAADQP